MNDLIPMNDMQAMASAIAKSGLFGAKTPDQALALMLVAQAEGLHPATAARDYHIIDGKPALKADAMLARFQASGGKVEWHEHTDTRVSATFSHPSGGSLRIEWDMARAKTAGLGGKAMWTKYPRQMLRARVISEGIRATNPGVAVGMYTPEEVQDFAPEKNMGTAIVVDDKPQAPAMPAYADADFQADLPTFTKLVNAGKKTPEQIITMVSSKVVPNAEQKAAILALKKDPPPAPTFAQVAERLQKAKDRDILDADADLIRSVADAGQREELEMIYRKRQAELEVTT